MQTIVCLMGPTASGKTPLAIELVQQLPFEIISVDSAMVYRGMDIGTAKPTAEILKIAPHHLIDICDPKESYSAGQFRIDALNTIKQIHVREKIPLLVGGTMMYFHVLQHGLAILPKANEKIRVELKARAHEIGWESLHAELAIIDPEAAGRIHPKDTQRIQRALEVYRLTGSTISTLQAEATNPLANYRVINIALMPTDRNLLHQKIALRFQQMLDVGLVEEVRHLYNRGDLHADLPAIRSVGYKQVWNYLQGQHTFEEMRELAITATRQLAKRQMTWLRSWQNVTLLNPEQDMQSLISKVKEILHITT